MKRDAPVTLPTREDQVVADTMVQLIMASESSLDLDRPDALCVALAEMLAETVATGIMVGALTDKAQVLDYLSRRIDEIDNELTIVRQLRSLAFDNTIEEN